MDVVALVRVVVVVALVAPSSVGGRQRYIVAIATNDYIYVLPWSPSSPPPAVVRWCCRCRRHHGRRHRRLHHRQRHQQQQVAANELRSCITVIITEYYCTAVRLIWSDKVSNGERASMWSHVGRPLREGDGVLATRGSRCTPRGEECPPGMTSL